MPLYLTAIVSPTAMPAIVARRRLGSSTQRESSHSVASMHMPSSTSGLSAWLSRTWRKLPARSAAATRPVAVPAARRAIAYTPSTLAVPTAAVKARPSRMSVGTSDWSMLAYPGVASTVLTRSIQANTR